MEAFLLERVNSKVVVGPVDLNTAAVTGLRVAMKDYERITFLCFYGASTSATAVDVTLRQHNAASSGTSKDLVVANKYYHKVGAATSYTKVEPTSAAAAYNLLSLVGDAIATVAFEVLAEDLDVNADFNYVSVDTSDSGAAKLGLVVAICHGAKNKPASALVL